MSLPRGSGFGSKATTFPLLPTFDLGQVQKNQCGRQYHRHHPLPDMIEKHGLHFFFIGPEIEGVFAPKIQAHFRSLGNPCLNPLRSPTRSGISSEATEWFLFKRWYAVRSEGGAATHSLPNTSCSRIPYPSTHQTSGG